MYCTVDGDGSRIQEVAPTSKGGGTNLLFGEFSCKLHENEGSWTRMAHLEFYYVDPPLNSI